eukprot:6145491-Pyramimonas_sp.AAC.1
MVQNSDGCSVSMNKRRRPQHIICKASKNHFPIPTDFWHSFGYQGKPTTLCYNKEACNAVLFYGTGRRRCVVSAEQLNGAPGYVEERGNIGTYHETQRVATA